MPNARDQQRQDTHDRIYRVALDAFRKGGLQAARIEDIARDAGVSRATFYFHFPTKEHVLLERMWETETEILADVEALGAVPLREVLSQINRSMARIWQADPQLLPDLAGVALRYTADHMSDREATQLRSALGERFEAAAAAGEVRVHLPGSILGDLYLGNVMAGLLAWFATPVLPLESVLEGVTWLFWNGAAGGDS
jgi:AcrR family transcriptional regulator